jgi:hypothetical protein
VQRLVHRVAAQVQQRAAGGDWEALGWRRLLHPRIEERHLAERAGGDDLPDGPEVRVGLQQLAATPL